MTRLLLATAVAECGKVIVEDTQSRANARKVLSWFNGCRYCFGIARWWSGFGRGKVGFETLLMSAMERISLSPLSEHTMLQMEVRGRVARV